MDLFDIFGITEEELKDEKKASAKPKKKEKKEKKEKKQGTNYKLPVSFCAGHLRHILIFSKMLNSTHNLNSHFSKFYSAVGLVF